MAAAKTASKKSAAPATDAKTTDVVSNTPNVEITPDVTDVAATTAKTNKTNDNNAPVSDETIEKRLESFAADLQAQFETAREQFNNIKALVGAFKLLVKDVNKAVKQGEKSKRKKSKLDAASSDDTDGEKPKRAPSGFARPTLLSDELCSFLGLDSKTELPRTEVTRIINKYIKENKLQDPADGRTILPDAALGKIIKLDEGKKLSYFNLQSGLKHHYLKAEVPATA
jgi:chromatin remodeling complex protein RSC6